MPPKPKHPEEEPHDSADDQQCRSLIFRRVVLDNRRLNSRELADLLGRELPPTARKIKDILAKFEKLGCRINITEGKKGSREYELAFKDGPHTDDDLIREPIAKLPKLLAARLAASLICGVAHLEKGAFAPSWFCSPEKLPKLTSTLDGKAEQVYWKQVDDALNEIRQRTRSVEDALQAGGMLANRIRALLHQLHDELSWSEHPFPVEDAIRLLELLQASASRYQSKVADITRQLQSFWKEGNRIVAIDSGTTNVRLAELLAGISIPVAGSCLDSLTVCTNSRRILQVLGPSEVPVRTVIIGGQQKNPSPTVAGALAELFLRTASILHFGLSIIGATKIDLQRFICCSDSQEEASIKTLMMEKSSIRVVLIDDSKLQLGPGRLGYRYASIDPTQIDLMIVNSPLKAKVAKTKTPDDETQADFRRKIDLIESRGVPVLVATSELTLPFVRTSVLNS